MNTKAPHARFLKFNNTFYSNIFDLFVVFSYSKVLSKLFGATRGVDCASVTLMCIARHNLADKKGGAEAP